MQLHPLVFGFGLVLFASSIANAEYRLQDGELYFGSKKVENQNYGVVFTNICNSFGSIKYNEAVAVWLLGHGVSEQYEDNLPIRCAAENGHTELVAELLRNSVVNPGAKNNEAIISASSKGYLEIVKLLLANSKTNPSAANNEALYSASRKGHLEVVKVLLENEKVQDANNYNKIIEAACSNGHAQVIELLLSKGAPSTANSCLIAASKEGHLAVVTLLLKRTDVNPNAENNLSLREACRQGHGLIVQRLLDQRAVDPAAENNYCIREASKRGHKVVVELLLKRDDVDPAAMNNYALLEAFESGHYDVVKLLKESGKVDISVIKYNLKNGLLYNGAKVHVKSDKNSLTEAYVRMFYRFRIYNETIAEWLIRNGVSVNAEENLPIRCAAKFGHTELVAKLLNNAEVDPAARNNEALQLASQNGHLEVVELLLKNYLVDAKEALEIAINYNYYGIVAIINKARPDLVIDKNVLKLAKKTFQVSTNFSLVNNTLIVRYESEYEYEATFVLSSMNDDSTTYVKVLDISKGELSLDVSKFSDISEWQWRWICAKQTIENSGKSSKRKVNLNTCKEPLRNEDSEFPISIVVSVVAFIVAALSFVYYVRLRLQKRTLDENMKL